MTTSVPTSLDLTAYSLQPNSLSGSSRCQPNSLGASLQPNSLGRASCRGFTLVEMLVVVVIISILVASGVGIYSQARIAAWKERTRDTARQIAVAWNQRLLDDGTFPTASLDAFKDSSVLSGAYVFQTLTNTMCILNSNNNGPLLHGIITSYIYIDQSAAERQAGMLDHWGQPFYVQLDTTYKSRVINPIDKTTVINANVLVWSMGPNPVAWDPSAPMAQKSNSYCMAWQ